MAVLREMEKRGHERVYYALDEKTGLRCIIAVHSTLLGPALGGTRMSLYPTEEDAIIDVLRLSRGMTYKSAVADLKLGGGKAVIIGDPEGDKSKALLRAYGRVVDELGGLYITAEDIGTTVRDMMIVRQETRWVTGLSIRKGGSGDPSPVTAFGVFHGMRAALEEVFGSDDFSGRTVAIQGIGKVGYPLAKMLVKAGAKLLVADINEEVILKAKKELGAKVVHPEEIHVLSVDIFSPNARGAVINKKTVKQIKAKIIAGAANNQLEDDKVQGPILDAMGVRYAVDFVINAGGVINVFGELERGGYNRKRCLERAARIYYRVKELFKISKQENIPTTEAAMVMVERRLEKARRKK